MTAESTSPAPPSPPIVAATSAILAWEHRRGGTAHCLIRLRTIHSTDGATGRGLA